MTKHFHPSGGVYLRFEDEDDDQLIVCTAYSRATGAGIYLRTTADGVTIPIGEVEEMIRTMREAAIGSEAQVNVARDLGQLP